MEVKNLLAGLVIASALTFAALGATASSVATQGSSSVTTTSQAANTTYQPAFLLPLTPKIAPAPAPASTQSWPPKLDPCLGC